VAAAAMVVVVGAAAAVAAEVAAGAAAFMVAAVVGSLAAEVAAAVAVAAAAAGSVASGSGPAWVWVARVAADPGERAAYAKSHEKRRCDRGLNTSALRRATDINAPARHVRKVPQAEVAPFANRQHRGAFALLEDVRKVFFVPLVDPKIDLSPLKHPVAFAVGLGGNFKFSEGCRA
jgi:hypothetical protein